MDLRSPSFPVSRQHLWRRRHTAILLKFRQTRFLISKTNTKQCFFLTSHLFGISYRNSFYVLHRASCIPEHWVVEFPPKWPAVSHHLYSWYKISNSQPIMQDPQSKKKAVMNKRPLVPFSRRFIIWCTRALNFSSVPSSWVPLTYSYGKDDERIKPTIPHSQKQSLWKVLPLKDAAKDGFSYPTRSRTFPLLPGRCLNTNQSIRRTLTQSLNQSTDQSTASNTARSSSNQTINHRSVAKTRRSHSFPYRTVFPSPLDS